MPEKLDFSDRQKSLDEQFVYYRNFDHRDLGAAQSTAGVWNKISDEPPAQTIPSCDRSAIILANMDARASRMPS